MLSGICLFVDILHTQNMLCVPVQPLYRCQDASWLQTGTTATETSHPPCKCLKMLFKDQTKPWKIPAGKLENTIPLRAIVWSGVD